MRNGKCKSESKGERLSPKSNQLVLIPETYQVVLGPKPSRTVTISQHSPCGRKALWQEEEQLLWVSNVEGRDKASAFDALGMRPGCIHPFYVSC